jgi:hypothetical protein
MAAAQDQWRHAEPKLVSCIGLSLNLSMVRLPRSPTSLSLLLRQVDAVLLKLRWPFCQPASTLGALFGWRRWVYQSPDHSCS